MSFHFIPLPGMPSFLPRLLLASYCAIPRMRGPATFRWPWEPPSFRFHSSQQKEEIGNDMPSIKDTSWKGHLPLLFLLGRMQSHDDMWLQGRLCGPMCPAITAHLFTRHSGFQYLTSAYLDNLTSLGCFINTTNSTNNPPITLCTD